MELFAPCWFYAHASLATLGAFADKQPVSELRSALALNTPLCEHASLGFLEVSMERGPRSRALQNCNGRRSSRHDPTAILPPISHPFLQSSSCISCSPGQDVRDSSRSGAGRTCPPEGSAATPPSSELLPQALGPQILGICLLCCRKIHPSATVMDKPYPDQTLFMSSIIAHPNLLPPRLSGGRPSITAISEYPRRWICSRGPPTRRRVLCDVGKTDWNAHCLS